MGTCVYHVGIQYGSWSRNQELDVLSKAMYHARELAMARMRAEAKGMGADGIVGVKLTIKRLEWECATAGVHRHRHRRGAWRRAHGLPRP